MSPFNKFSRDQETCMTIVLTLQFNHKPANCKFLYLIKLPNQIILHNKKLSLQRQMFKSSHNNNNNSNSSFYNQPNLRNKSFAFKILANYFNNYSISINNYHNKLKNKLNSKNINNREEIFKSSIWISKTFKLGKLRTRMI